MEFKEVSDIKECERLWNIFSPHRTIYQEWDWRYTHYKYLNYHIKFMVGIDANQPIGILPLQYEPEEEFWEFFGGPEMEDNGIWTKPGYEKYAEDFLKAVDDEMWLDCLAEDSEFIKSLPTSDISYELDLEKYASTADFVNKHLTGSLQRHAKGALRLLGSEVSIVYNQVDDLEILFDLNQKIFGSESSFAEKNSKEIFYDLVKLPYRWHIFSIVIADRKVATELALVFDGVFYALAAGYNREIKNLGLFLNLQNIDEAKKMGAEKINFGYHDCGWKERWGLSRIVYHEYWHGLTPED